MLLEGCVPMPSSFFSAQFKLMGGGTQPKLNSSKVFELRYFSENKVDLISIS